MMTPPFLEALMANFFAYLIIIAIGIVPIVYAYDFLRCKHEYEKVEEIVVWSSPETKIPQHYVYLYKCKKCGKFKKIILDGQ